MIYLLKYMTFLINGFFVSQYFFMLLTDIFYLIKISSSFLYELQGEVANSCYS